MRYEIKGGSFPVLMCSLNDSESICCQRGAMSWMTPNMQMSTTGNGLGKMFSRAISGESIFRNKYTATGGPGEIAFSSTVPGSILAVEISSCKSIIAQKSAYLASVPSVEMNIFFQKKFGAGFFGGEGFIMQQFTGDGTVFLEIDGSLIEYELAAGQSLILDTGYLVAMDATCSMNIESVGNGGLGNVIFGGEGLFNTKVSGPGHVWLQSMPVPALANSIRPYISTNN